MNAELTTEGLRLRRDLIFKKLDMAPRALWVLKDPLSRELHYVSEEELAILKLLDGTRTLKEILKACSNQFSTRFIAPDSLVSFLADAQRRHLIVVRPSMNGNDGSAPVKSFLGAEDRKSWTRFLAWKLPGVRDSRWLDSPIKLLSPWISPASVGIFFLLVLSAAMIAIAYLPEILNDVSAAFLARTSETLVQLFVVIGITKIIHEFAHAFACRYFGGDCREMGVMLLMGMPCLYCDVSDAWLMPQRYKRILVSAAGMIAEFGLASLATFVWLVADDPVLSQWCLIVMTVCSFSSVLVNGNPLMRYDGYFILSDLCGIPNLAKKATQSLRRVVQSLMGNDVGSPNLLDESDHRRWLPAYAMASLLYRSVLFLSLAWFLYHFTAGHRITVVGIVVGACLVVGTLVPELRAMVAPAGHGFASHHHTGRNRKVQAFILCTLLLGLLIPLPQTLLVPMRIQPADSQTVFARSHGTLWAHVREGDMVNAGDLIASIEQPEVVRTLVEAESELATLVTTRLNLENTRQAKPELSASLQAAKKAEDAARERVALMKRENDHLSIKSPIAGVVFAESFSSSEPEDEEVETTLHGTLLDSLHQGIAIKLSEAICTVGSSSRREAILHVGQKHASLVRSGQQVELLIKGTWGQRIRGNVVEVSSTPSQVAHVQPLANEDESSIYQVRAILEDTSSPVPVRLTGQARIWVEPKSIASRLLRRIQQSLRF